MSTQYEGIVELYKAASIEDANEYLANGWVVCFIGNNPFQTVDGYVDKVIIVLGRKE